MGGIVLYLRFVWTEIGLFRYSEIIGFNILM